MIAGRWRALRARAGRWLCLVQEGLAAIGAGCAERPWLSLAWLVWGTAVGGLIGALAGMVGGVP